MLTKKVARQWYTLPVGERWVNPLPDEASRAKWEPEKKDPLRGSFFFLPAFGRYCAFGAARLRHAAPSARPPPNWIALAHGPTSHS